MANTIPPTLNITYPANASFLNEQPLWLNITSQADADSDPLNISYYVNGTLNQTSLTNVTFNASDGIYHINISLFDGNASSANATLNITLDTSAPQISYTTETLANNSIVSQSYIFINVSIVEVNENNITFFLYNTTSGVLLNNTNFTNATRSINFTNLGNGNYIYNVTVRDKVSLEGSTGSRNITLDTAAPTITLFSPINNSGDNDGNITFSYSVTDFTLLNCSLFLDNIVNVSNASLTSGSYLFNKSGLQNSFNWSVQCRDNASNVQTTGYHSVRIITATEFNGSATTDLNSVNLSNITNLILEVSPYGKINFTDSVSIESVSSLNAFINISDNLIDLDSNNLPQLNKTANLYLNGITFTNPRPLRNGEVCSTICTEISFTNDTFIFNVTQFTNYSSEDTPVTTTTTTTSSGGGGGGAYGGGGGGGGAIEAKFSASPSSIKERLRLGEKVSKSVEFRNTGDNQIIINLNVDGIDAQVSRSSIDLAPGEEKAVSIRFEAEELGTHAGRLVATSRETVKEIALVFEVESLTALFDVKLDLPAESREIAPGQDLKAQITLFNVLGGNVDVLASYLVKDLEGRILSEESETFAVKDQKSYSKVFTLPTGMVAGNYVAAIEVKYLDSFAVSSELFTISDEAALRLESQRTKVRLLSIIALIATILFVNIAIAVYVMRRRFYNYLAGRRQQRAGKRRKR